MLNEKKEKFFKKLIDEHIFGDSVDADGWHWFGENKYQAFGKEKVVIVEVCDAFGCQTAFTHESYEEFFDGWSVTFSDWLMDSLMGDGFECWNVSIGEILKLHEYGYLEDCFAKELIRVLKMEVKE